MTRAALLSLAAGALWMHFNKRAPPCCPAGSRAAVLRRRHGRRPPHCRIVYRTLRGLCAGAYYNDDRVWPMLGYDGPLVGRKGAR